MLSNGKLLFSKLILLCNFLFLVRLYKQKDINVNLESLLTLRAECQDILVEAEEHFRVFYIREPTDTVVGFNPYFIVAWQVSIFQFL